MARQRVQTQYAANQVRLTPQASPVDTYVQPARNDQISRALEQVTGNVSRKVSSDKRKNEQSNAAAFQIQKLQVAEAAYANGELGSWDKIKGDFSLSDNAQYGPALQVVYNQKLGVEAGYAIQSELAKWNSENSDLRLSDPVSYNTALDAETHSLLKAHLGPDSIDAVGYASSMRTQVTAMSNQLKSQQFSEYNTAQAKLPLENFLTQLGAGVNVAELGATGTPEERVAAIGESVNSTVQAMVATKTMSNSAVNSAATDYLITLATEKGDLSILQIAKNIGTGGGYLWGIQSEKKKLIAAQFTIANRLESEEAKKYRNKQRKDQIGKTDYQEAAYQYYRIHENFEEFEGPTSSEGMGLYDIDVIQKRIQGFKESPQLTQSDYEHYHDQFSAIEELDEGRAREMIGNMPIESMAEWKLAESAMSDVLRKRGSVFSHDSYKSAVGIIDRRYGIDPQKAMTVTNLSLKALADRNNTLADLKARATSYIIDQEVLDSDLKAIDYEDLKGTSIYTLTADVKAKLYKHVANEAYKDHATDINNKSIGGDATSVLQDGETVTINGSTITVTKKE